MDAEPKRTVRLLSYHEDQPTEARGALIPRSIAIDELIAEPVGDGAFQVGTRPVARVLVWPVATLAALALLVSVSYQSFAGGSSQLAAPVVTVIDPFTARSAQLQYGPEEALAAESLFSATQAAFIEAAYSFVAVDAEAKVLRYFENGVLVLNEPIEAIGEAGSWWETPSGLYQVSAVDERKFSSYAQVYFPYSLTFEGNYLIHGAPALPDGTSLQETSAGGIRVADATAKQLTGLVAVGTPVVVRGVVPPPPEEFIYQQPVAAVTAPHYLVADIETGAVLAGSDVAAEVPVASLTKLMTAIVAAEQMNLDQRVYQETPTFVESLVPRLQDRTTVSMYSLLQLLLVESSNEAAEVIATEYGRIDFIDEMNKKARAIGMTDTTFADPSGLSADNTSTLLDLFTLTQYIYQKRSFIFEITETGEAVGVTGGGEFTNLNNFNVVDTTDTFIGGKIGETTAAGQTSVSLHRLRVQGAERIVAVVLLGSSARSADVTTLLSTVTERFNQ